MRHQERVSRLVRSLFGAVLAVGLCVAFAVGLRAITMNGATPQDPGKPETPAPTRVVVKLAPALAERVEAHLKDGNAPESDWGDPEITGFLSRHGAKGLKPAFPGVLRQRGKSHMSEAEWVQHVRKHFPRRAARADAHIKTPELSRVYVLQSTEQGPDALQNLAARLRSDSAVEWAEVDNVVSVAYVPNDPFYGSHGTWGQSYDDLWGLKKIGAATFWDITNGAGTVVAIVDTGFDFNHPDLAANIWTNADEIPGNGVDDDGNGYVDDVRGWDFVGSYYGTPTPDNDPNDGYGHGTHVAGTVAAVGNNGVGVIGVAWGAKVMAVKGLDSGGYGATTGLAAAIRYAADNGADIINNSWGGAGDSQVIAEALDYAASVGVVVVCAAGNNEEDVAGFYPARYPHSIAVAATNAWDSTSWFSNWGSRIDVAAPGEDILSLHAAGTYMGTLVGTDYARADGTSMASPHVAGVCALLLAQHPEWTAEQVRQALRVSAYDLYPTGADLNHGYGRVDAAAASGVARVLEARILAPADGTRVTGPTTVEGIARGEYFATYRLEYGSGNAPTTWTLIQEGTSPVDGGTLGTFDPSLATDGYVTLRLTVRDVTGRPFEDRLRVVVDFATIVSPAPPRVPDIAQVFKPGAIVSVQGKATGPSFQSFHLEWARGINATSGWSSAGITPAGGGISPVAGGELGTWNTSGIDQADYYSLRLVVVNDGFTSESRTLVYLEPDLISVNWPRWLPAAPNMGSGVVPWHEASGATRLSIAVPSSGGNTVSSLLYTFSPDGSQVSQTPLYNPAFPQPAAGNLDGQPGDEVVVAEADAIRVVRPDGTSFRLLPGRRENFQWALVQLADLDNDGQDEILAWARNSSTSTADLFAWRQNGQLVSANFPIVVGNLNSGLDGYAPVRVLVADIDGNGSKDILFFDGVSSSAFTIRAYSRLGVPLAGWPAPTFDTYPVQAALADLEDDGLPELIFITRDNARPAVHVLRANGTDAPGWPQMVSGSSWGSSLALGDVDRDGRDEIVVSVGAVIYIFRGDGTTLSAAWPHDTRTTGNSGNVLGPVILADVTGDGFPEVLTSAYDWTYSSYPQPAAERTVQEDASGNLVVRTRIPPPPNAEAEPAISWLDTKLIAIDRTATLVRSWRILGANGNQPVQQVTPAAGDFDGDGTLDIALTWQNVLGGGTSGWIGEGVISVLTTGVPAVASDWPSIFHDTRNSASVIRPDLQPPTVTLTSPTSGAIVSGPIEVAAAASDDTGVRGVTFLLDGVALAPEDTSPPFAVTWDVRLSATGLHQLLAVARDRAQHATVSEPVIVMVVRDNAAPTAAIVAPQDGATVIGFVPVQVDAQDDRGVTRVELWVDGALRTSASAAPYVLTWDASGDGAGPHTLLAKAYDQALNVGTSAQITVNLLSAMAVYNSAFPAPFCENAANVCDSGGLLVGRGTVGPEPNAPNTIYPICGDSNYGSFHVDPSLDHLRVTSLDGSRMRAGRQIKVEATVWASSGYAYEALDIFRADAYPYTNWYLVATVYPTRPGAQTLTATFTLPGWAQPAQAVRGSYRGTGAAPDVCPAYEYFGDRDDLVFTIAQANGVPTANAGGPYQGTVNVPVHFDGRQSSDPDGDPLTYSWDWGDGSAGAGVTPIHAYSAVGTYTVTLTVNDGINPSSPATTTVTIGSNRPPVANAGGPYSGFRWQSITFNGTASDPDGDPLMFRWDFGDGASETTGPTPTHSYATAGTFTVILVVNDGTVDSEPVTATVTITNRAPVASAGGPYLSGRKDPITFDGTGSYDLDGDGLTYRWDFGDGATGTGVSPTHAYTTPGTFTATLTVNDGTVDSAPATATVTILNRPPMANAGGPYSGVRNQAIAFSGSASSDADGDPLTYRWTFGDGATGTGATPTHAYASVGSFTVTLIVNDGFEDSPPATATSTITNRVPVANAGGPYTGLRGQAITFNGGASSDPDGDPLTYRWDFGDGSTGTGVAPAHAYAPVGTFTVTLTVNDGTADSTPATATVTITNRVPVANAGGPYTGVRNQAVAFNGGASSDPDGDPLTYRWAFGDGATGTGATPTHAYAAAGSFTVTLTVNDGTADSTPATATVTITNRVPVANAGGPYTGVRNQAVAFNGGASSDPDGDPLTYRWAFGDGATGTGASPAHTYATVGTFTVTLTVNDGTADSAPATATVTITNRVPVANAGGPYAGVRGQTIAFNGSASSDPDGDGLTYRWDFGDGATGTGVAPTHAYATLGTFIASLIVNDGTVDSVPATATVTIGNRAPVANAGGPYTGTRLTAVAFSGAASSDADGDPLTYRWSFGDGGTGTGVTPAHLYTTIGTFTVTLTVNDGSTDSQPATTTVTIGNVAPGVAITSPAPGSVFTAPATFVVTASANDPDGAVSKVEFFAGNVSLGTVVTAPYSITWMGATPGSYALSAVVTDSSGGTVTSAPVPIVVNAPPSVSLTAPADQARFPSPATITLTASATDIDGAIAKVEFFRGTTSLGAATSSPYSLTWSDAPAGSYTVTAVATDNWGAVTVSSPITVNVTTEIAPTADAYVREQFKNQNFGTATTLTVQLSGGDERWTYLMVDLSGVSAVTDARLRLRGAVSATTTATIQTAVYPVSDTTWNETDIRWRDKPPTGTEPIATVIIANDSTTPQWYEWNVTAYLQAEKAAGRNVVTLALRNPATASPYVTFSSREDPTAANRPRLVVIP